jgi:hypothetical protein
MAAMRFLTTVLAIALSLAACGLSVGGPGPDPSGSLAVSDRIAAIGKGQDWYAAINVVNGRPDATRYQGGWSYVQVRVAPGVDPGSAIVARACDAIATAVNNPKYGPSVDVTSIELIPIEMTESSSSHKCWTPEAESLPS